MSDSNTSYREFIIKFTGGQVTVHSYGGFRTEAKFVVGGTTLRVHGRQPTDDLLLAALHRLNELGVTDLGSLDDFTQGSPAKAGTATTAAHQPDPHFVANIRGPAADITLAAWSSPASSASKSAAAPIGGKTPSPESSMLDERVSKLDAEGERKPSTEERHAVLASTLDDVSKSFETNDSLREPVEGWGTPGIRLHHAEKCIQDLSARLDDIEENSGSGGDVQVRLSKLEERIVELESSSMRDTSSIAGHRVALHSQQRAMEAIATKLENLDARSASVTLADNTMTLVDHLQFRLSNLEAAAKDRGSHVREASWLYQVINPTLDEIDEMLPRWQGWSNQYDTAGSLGAPWNRSVMRDLASCNEHLREIFDNIVKFKGSPHSVGESAVFYGKVRAVLIEFSVDTCSRLGISAAPPRSF